MPEARPPEDETRARKRDGGASSEKHDEHARLFYERLEQSGQLVDVEADADVATLPPHVTHVRYPDGTVERIGFSASP